MPKGLKENRNNNFGNNQFMTRGNLHKTPQERLEENRKITEDGHWLWLGSTDRDGYGVIGIDKHQHRVHRVAYKIYNGVELDNDIKVLHKPPCTVRACFNPEHLYLGDEHDNMQDCILMGNHWQLSKTHCPQGHPYDEENTRIINGKRYCIKCQDEYIYKGSNKIRLLNKQVSLIENIIALHKFHKAD